MKRQTYMCKINFLPKKVYIFYQTLILSMIQWWHL